MKNNVGSKKIISIILITLLLLFTTKVNAATDSFSTTLKASNSQVKRGNNVTITIGLKNIAIKSGEKGIGGYTAKVKFDSSVLEYVSTNGTNKWEAPFYQNGLITGNTKDGNVVNTAQSIGTITFKVKKGAKLGETAIELTNFSGSTAATDVSTSNKSVKITIVDNSSNNAGTNNNGNSNNSSSNNKNNNNSNKENSNSKNSNSNTNNKSNKSTSKSNTSKEIDTTVKKGVLPKTGIEDIRAFIWILIFALAIIIFAIIGYFIHKDKE